MPERLLAEDAWAIVEVLGHNLFAGKVSEHVIGGAGFIRVDVPELPERRCKRKWSYQDEEVEDVIPAVPAFTKLIGASSIYAITPCTGSRRQARGRGEARCASQRHRYAGEWLFTAADRRPPPRRRGRR